MGLPGLHPRLRLLNPLDYLSFLALMSTARMVVTDSGGVQEETIYRGVPCLTIRPNTERPLTITCGTDRIVHNTAEVLAAAREVGGPCRRSIPELWDGQTAGRIVQVLAAADLEQAVNYCQKGQLPGGGDAGLKSDLSASTMYEMRRSL